MQLNPFNKIFAIVIVLSVTVLYAVRERNKIYEMSESAPVEIAVKSIPEFEARNVFRSNLVNHKNILTAKVNVLHFWGTWCGPCESEFPSLIEHAKKFEGKDVKYSLIAVNDSKEAVMKFLKRFKELPTNVEILIDENGGMMEKFGIFKVPETYVFNKEGQMVKKYSGPQEWNKDYYSTQVSMFLSL